MLFWTLLAIATEIHTSKCIRSVHAARLDEKYESLRCKSVNVVWINFGNYSSRILFNNWQKLFNMLASFTLLISKVNLNMHTIHTLRVLVAYFAVASLHHYIIASLDGCTWAAARHLPYLYIILFSHLRQLQLPVHRAHKLITLL
jgi:hypothetical protein